MYRSHNLPDSWLIHCLTYQSISINSIIQNLSLVYYFTRDEIMRILIMSAWEQVETINRIISNGEQLKQMGILPELSKPIIRSRQEYKLATFNIWKVCKQNYGLFPSRDTLCNPIKWTGTRSFIITTMPSDRSKGETQLIRLVNQLSFKYQISFTVQNSDGGHDTSGIVSLGTITSNAVR